ncbi:LamG-like jellyroll fold domain-containing protein [Actinoplanes sp. NPDC051494]|uniref:LamG-like jellyroll fold domain-containing protein n=1 Tax=Actinoplanes sp. NPDC051494 TaxID=3363907 RepID=UPI0037AC5E6C
MTYRRVVLPVVLAGLMLGPVTPAAPAFAAPADPDPGSVVVRYTFDGGRASGIADESGNGHTLRLVAGSGGTVEPVPHRSGQALRFPAKCAAGQAKRSTCPHATLQSASSDALNPGNRPFAFGATVLLAPSQTSSGQNILQKGYSTASSQWKLQIDGDAGHPSCVLVDDRKPGIEIVRSSVSVADGHWHDIECRRRGSALSVLVDGVDRGTQPIPAQLSVTNDFPLSVGGKGAYRDNDQFQGLLDDVWAANLS